MKSDIPRIFGKLHICRFIFALQPVSAHIMCSASRVPWSVPFYSSVPGFTPYFDMYLMVTRHACSRAPLNRRRMAYECEMVIGTHGSTLAIGTRYCRPVCFPTDPIPIYIYIRIYVAAAEAMPGR